MSPGNPPCAVWRHHEQWHAAWQPVRTLRIDTGEELARLPMLHRQLLDDAGPGWVCGALSYDAGSRLLGVAPREPSSPAGAVIHYFDAADVAKIANPNDPLLAHQDDGFMLAGHFTSEMTAAEYRSAVMRIREYLVAGDVYQVNFARRYRCDWTGHPFRAWQQLAQHHPAPHASYLHLGDHDAVFGVSPERFLRIDGRKVITEPIKGSRPRGGTLAEDDRLANDLASSDKDRAENLMIVDLLRNDLGKVCKAGSVNTENLFELRRFSNVQHLVSTVTGVLRDDVTPFDALLSCFPGGSITGAPKKRAMEIINELEPAPRGFYCGSQFSIDPAGNLDSNILIRTFQTDGNHIYCHGGGGIVIDSDPDQEYAESAFKVSALMQSL